MLSGRILVLEADEQLGSAILSALNEAAPDAQVEVASRLEEAQRFVLDVRPDLFVLDLDAAPEPGQDFLYDLRTSHPNARAIILTAAHLPLNASKSPDFGAIHFLEKPFPHGENFVELVEALLRPRGGRKPKNFTER